MCKHWLFLGTRTKNLSPEYGEDSFVCELPKPQNLTEWTWEKWHKATRPVSGEGDDKRLDECQVFDWALEKEHENWDDFIG